MPAYIHYLFGFLALGGALWMLACGPRLRTSIDARSLRLRFLGIGAVLMLLVETPLLHGAHCSTSPAAALYPLQLWWLPYAAYSLGTVACAVRLLGREDVRRRAGLALGALAVLLAALWLEWATRRIDALPWWTVHVAFQVPFFFFLWRSTGPRVRAFAFALPLLSLALPFVPLSFWHAAVRLREGDPIAEVRKHLGDYWIVLNPSTGGDRRAHLRIFDPASLGDGELTFVGRTGVHYDVCHVWIRDGRIARVSMAAD